MKNSTEIKTPLRIKLGLAAILAMLLTIISAFISYAGMDPDLGRIIALGTLLVLPLVIAAKCEWTPAASVIFAYLTYFVFTIALVLFIMRKK